ncbi:peptidase inhibitor family I36 protein [Streptomyces kanamyceticus]
MLSVGIAAPSFAHEGIEAGALTVYKDTGFSGGWHSFTGSDGNLEDNKWNDGTGSVNDSISSLKNTSSHTVLLCTGAGYTGPFITVRPGQAVSEVVNDALREHISSIKFL